MRNRREALLFIGGSLFGGVVMTIKRDLTEPGLVEARKSRKSGKHKSRRLRASGGCWGEGGHGIGKWC